MGEKRTSDRGKTRVKGVRVSDELWERVAEVAESRGETRSTAIRRLLAEYVGDPSLGELPESEMNRVQHMPPGAARKAAAGRSRST